VLAIRSGTGAVSDGGAPEHGPFLGGPRGFAVDVQAVEKLDEEAGILDNKSTHPKPALVLER
jgi:hypothetical protein